MRRRPREQDDNRIECSKIQDNETWNSCPECGKDWKELVAIPGLIHRTRLCSDCLKRPQKTDTNIM